MNDSAPQQAQHATDSDQPAGELARLPKPPPRFLLHDSSLDLALVKPLCEDAAVSAVPWAERATLPAEARVFVYCGDEQVRDLALMALENRWEVGILPHPDARQAMTAMGVKGDVLGLLRHYLEAPVIQADAVTCNGELVFSSVVIGRVLALRPYDINRPQTARSLVTGALKGVGKLRLSPYKITTGKSRDIHLAALGMVAVGQTQSSLVGRAFSDELGIADGRVSVLAFAPRSVFNYLLFLLRLLWPTKIRLSRLPSSLTLLQSNRLTISAARGMEYLLDGKPVHANEMELAVLETRLRLLPGNALVLRRSDEARVVEKETVRLNHIPLDEAAKQLVNKNLPLFNHATEEEYRELFRALRDNATPTSTFQVLMVLSVLLALGGMYANSAPVIIGAMILAPLMSPIISLSMGLARTDAGLIRISLRTLAIGVGWALACALSVALFMPLEIPTAEMKARMSPTLLDLLVAVISGIAGAYANAKEDIAKSLAGVAIAVALVPPLSVVGIGLGWGDWEMAWGSGLLFVTNLVGIALAASATFLVLGFAPFKRARAGMGIALAIMLVISVPLSLSFSHLVLRDRILEHVPLGEIEVAGFPVTITAAEVTLGDPHLVRVQLSAAQTLTPQLVDELKQLISLRVGEPVVLDVQSNLRR
ncbi:MAG: TIGR00341 family protein [Halioglobus sp.]|nr:TIGR00341 family protein [Halioglobus sp.]